MPEVYKQSFKQNYTNNVDLSVFNCGLERCAPGHTWGPGIRDHYLIHLILAGKGTFQTGGRTWELAPGDLFFVQPNQLNTYAADTQQPWEYCWVGFNGISAHRLASLLPFSEEQPVHHTQRPEEMFKAMENIYRARGLRVQDETAMVGYLYLFIAALMEETGERRLHNTSSSSQYVLNAIKYIQFNYSHDISIDDVAKSVGVSRSHLYRVFMSNVGKSPIDYLTEYRINEACKLLQGGTLSIAEVAISVGFFDQFYFSRVFKRAKGVPPSKYIASPHAAVSPATPHPPRSRTWIGETSEGLSRHNRRPFTAPKAAFRKQAHTQPPPNTSATVPAPPSAKIKKKAKHPENRQNVTTPDTRRTTAKTHKTVSNLFN